MHYFWTGLLGLVALTWVITSVRAVRGMSSLPRLSQVTPAPDDDCPTVSILVAARDEAEKLPAALATLLAQNYPRYEVIAVNDRSNDPTGQILDEFARTHKNLKVIHLTELPPGWLGKPHALTTAFKQATGDWLVFTDADVHFAPDVLRRTVALVQERHWDHLTAMAFIELKGFWEKTVVTFFALGFILSLEPWQVSNPRSRHYMGMGAFQLLRRSAYEAVGTHRRLAMEVVDDVKLGKLVKRAGFRSGVALSEERIRLRWQDGVGNIIRGLTKNSFAFHGYNPGVTLFLVVAVLALHVLPLVAVVFTSGLTRALAVVGTLTVMLFHAHHRLPQPRIAALRAHQPPRSCPHRLHHAALDGGHALARRRGLARHLLSLGRIAQRPSLTASARTILCSTAKAGKKSWRILHRYQNIITIFPKMVAAMNPAGFIVGFCAWISEFSASWPERGWIGPLSPMSIRSLAAPTIPPARARAERWQVGRSCRYLFA